MTCGAVHGILLPMGRGSGVTRQSVERRGGALEALRRRPAPCYRCAQATTGGGDADRTITAILVGRAGGDAGACRRRRKCVSRAPTGSARPPAEAGFNPQLLKDAVDFAIASEVKNPRDLKLNHYRTFGREPFGDAIGPIKDRGDQTGVIVHKGAIVAEWGEPQRIDMTHSVTKSFLSSVVGVAVDSGMIRSIDDTARDMSRRSSSTIPIRPAAIVPTAWACRT